MGLEGPGTDGERFESLFVLFGEISGVCVHRSNYFFIFTLKKIEKNHPLRILIVLNDILSFMMIVCLPA